MRHAPRRPVRKVGMFTLLFLVGCGHFQRRDLAATVPDKAASPSSSAPESPARASEVKPVVAIPGPSPVEPVGARSSGTARPSPSGLPPPPVYVRPPDVEPSVAAPPLSPQLYRDNGGTGSLHRDGDNVRITGIAEHLYVRNVWRIRYARCAGDDPFNGSITLANSALNSELHPGRLACIEGQMIDTKEGRRFVLLDVHEIDDP